VARRRASAAPFRQSRRDDPLNAFATHGIPVPTYGNYGGPGYTAGQFGAKTPEPSQLTPEIQPVDQLDQLFYQHDLVHQHFSDGAATFSDIVTADITLIVGMAALDYTDPVSRTMIPKQASTRDFRRLAPYSSLRPSLRACTATLRNSPTTPQS
jgi:hypothetical protein